LAIVEYAKIDAMCYVRKGQRFENISSRNIPVWWFLPASCGLSHSPITEVYSVGKGHDRKIENRVRVAKLTDSASDTYRSFFRKRTKILTGRRKTAIYRLAI